MSSEPPPNSPAALERAITERRNHLAATVNELAFRAKPQQLAKRTGAEISRKLRGAVQTPEGELRKERIGAVGGALVVLAGLAVWLRRRRR